MTEECEHVYKHYHSIIDIAPGEKKVPLFLECENCNDIIVHSIGILKDNEFWIEDTIYNELMIEE